MNKHTTSKGRDATVEERADLKEQLLDRAGGAMGFEVRAKKTFRHPATATMVRQLLFWEGKKVADPEGYAYITYAQWWDEEALSKRNVNTARRKLKEHGVLEEDRKGFFNRIYYRLKLERLMEVMSEDLDPPAEDDPVAENQTLNHNISECGPDKLVSAERETSLPGSGYLKTETTHQGTSGEVSPLGPPKGAEEEKNEPTGRDDVASSARTAQPPPPEEEQRGGAVKERPPRRRSRSGGRSPDAVIEALRVSVHGKYGYPDLEKAAKIAERFDFTSDDEPPRQIMKELNDDRQYFEKARTVAQRAIPGPVREAHLEAEERYARRCELLKRSVLDEAEAAQRSPDSPSDAPVSAPEGVKRGTGQETDSEGAETILEAEDFPAPTLEAVA